MAKKRKAWLKKLLGLSLALAMTIQPLPAAFGGMGVVSAAEAIEQEVTVEQAVTDAYGVMKNADGTLTLYVQQDANAGSAPTVMWEMNVEKENPTVADLIGYDMKADTDLGENYWSYTTTTVADTDTLFYCIAYVPVGGVGRTETSVLKIAVADIEVNEEQPGGGASGDAFVFKDMGTVFYRSQNDSGWGGDSNAVITFDGTTATVTADNFGTKEWAVQWQNIVVSSKAESNILSFEVISDINKSINVKNELTNEMITVELEAGVSKTVQIGGGAQAKFVMDLSFGGPGTLTFSNMTYKEGFLEPVIPDDGSDDTLFASTEALNFEEISKGTYNAEEDVNGNWANVSNAEFTYTGTTAVVSADSFGGEVWGLQLSLKDLTSTSSANVFEFEVLSTVDKTIVFKDENAVKEYTLTLTAGQKQRFAYAIEGNTFSTTFGLGYGAGSLTFSNVKFGPNASVEEAPAVAPAQKSDKKNGFKVGDAVVLNATDAAAWANAISSVVVNNKTVAAENYEVDAEAGTVTIAADVFTKQNVYKIEIAADGYAKATITVPVYDTEVANEEWTKVWSDEFDGDSLDENNWSYEIGVKSGDDTDSSNGAPIYWGNDEKEYYTKESVQVKDGYLVITGDKLTDEVKAQYDITDGFVQYSSGRIRTITDEGKVLAGTTYGRVEAKMSMPAEAGYWPAFWMLPTTETIGVYGGWPASGELDIMEAVGQNPGKVDGTIHYGGSDWTKHVYSGGNYYFTDGSDIADEHVYAVEWEPGEIRWYVDDVLYHIENNWYGADATGQNYSYPAPYDEEFYILFNLAMSGNYVSNVDPTVMGGQMKVDYVRILMEQNTDYDAEVNEPAAIEKDTEFFEANKGYTDLIVDKKYTTLLANKYGDGGNLLPGNEKWWSSVNDGAGAAGTVEVVDGVAKIDVTAVGANDYNVQLIQNIPLAQGYTYRVTFDAWTDVAAGRTIRVAPGGDCNHGWTSYSTGITAELGTTKEPFTFDFTMAKESDPSARFEMNLGASTGTVYIDNVSVIALTDEQLAEDDENGSKEPLANGEYIYNGTFDKGTGRIGYWTMEGAEGSTANRDYTVTVGNDETKLIQTGLKLTEYDDYKLTFDASTLGAGKVLVALTDETGEYGYVAEEFELTADAEKYELSFTVLEGNGTDMGTLTFTFIGEGETVTIDNVSMKRLTNAGIEWDKYAVYPLGEGTDALNGWTVYDHTTYLTTDWPAKDFEDGYGFEVATRPLAANWNILIQSPEVAYAKGMTYVIKYAVRASADNQPVSVVLETTGNVSCYNKTFTVGTEWTEIEETFVADSAVAKRLKFLLSGVDKECNMYVKDVSIELDAPKPQFAEGKEISEMKVGDTAKLEFEHDRKVKDKYNVFTYSTKETDVISLDAEGNVKALAAGTATIVVKSAIGTENTFTITVIGEEPSPVENPFGDVPENQWYYKYVMFAYKNDLVKGKEDDRFAPGETITRAEFVQILYNKENKPAVEFKDTFPDVKEGDWFWKAIIWANENGVASGTGTGEFRPNEEISREQIAQILYNYATYKDYSTAGAADLTGFEDDENISTWAVNSMKWAVECGVMKGTGDNKLLPTGKAVRADATTMVVNFMKAFEDAEVN